MACGPVGLGWENGRGLLGSCFHVFSTSHLQRRGVRAKGREVTSPGLVASDDFSLQKGSIKKTNKPYYSLEFDNNL